MKGMLIFLICMLLSCSWTHPIIDGKIYHFKSHNKKLTKYYVKVSNNGLDCVGRRYFSFIDKTGKYKVGDKIVYMAKSN